MECDHKKLKSFTANLIIFTLIYHNDLAGIAENPIRVQQRVEIYISFKKEDRAPYQL